MKHKILVVDDEVSILQSLKGVLNDEGYRVALARTGEEALDEVRKEVPDLVLLDVWLPGIDGLSVLGELRSHHPHLPVIIISGHGSIETAVKATKLGAFDFVEKPLSLERILVSVQNGLELTRLQEDNRIWRQKASSKVHISGRSPVIEALREQIRLAAPTNATVLITGENGTGKELVARLIHNLSRRSHRPMIEVNCAAIPEELIESELFGHEKGAFTGAHERRKGRFDLANGGTLFLDEIGDMSLKTQAKVLRILQEQIFERVGGTRPIQVDVRVVSATNKDLQKAIETGQFRQDLYYRLNVIPIDVPPLRDRLQDIPLLVEDFVSEMALQTGIGRKELDRHVMDLLQQYHWPGNVRELRNFVERLIIMTPGQKIRPENLPKDFLSQLREPPAENDIFRHQTLREARNAFERQYLLRKLDENQWNVSLTASQIGVERSHLHRKMKALGIGESEETTAGEVQNPS
ncbi:MAG: sigma-54 dependent transcriptional regulator [Syntrophobacteraceae bacterium]|jgi:two-component system nitrogen regulation response regulator NtrX|nr:sigma-54 dependent transcriptional regulator [Syntrophobacteraceae bacterium]